MNKILLLLILAFSTTAFSQNIRFEGTVKDTVGVGLEMANIMAINQQTKAMDAYAITNETGKFILNLKANTAYTVKVSYIGFQTFEKAVTTATTAINYPVILKEGTQLKEIEVVHVMPVTVSGDTIIYNSDSFTNGTERKLEDVLKKLPGMEVSKDGEITIEGKTAQKVMIDGKDFFDGDTKLATKNIPADAIDKIQVLRNYNEVSNLKGLENNQDNIAINIKLKEGKKNFWFGDVNVAGGFKNSDADRYMINPKLFYYSPKYSINIITNKNNIGELPLTARDYFKLTGGFRNISGKGGSSFNVTSNDLGILGNNNDQAASIDTQFGAANFSYNPTKKITFSGFGIFSGNTTVTQENSLSNRNDNLPNGTIQQITETRTDNTRQESNLAIVKLSSSYVPSAKLHVDYDVYGKISDQVENQNLNSSLLDDIYANKKQNPYSINQNLNFYYTLNDKHVFAFETQHLLQEEDPFYNANLANQPFVLNGYTSGQARNDVNQSRLVKTNKLDSKFDYYYMVTPKSNINLTIGNTLSSQNFNSSIFQILDNGTRNDLSSSENNNNVAYLFNDLYLGLHYKFITGKFTFNPGFSVHTYNTKDTQLGTENKMNFGRFLPDVFVNYQIKKSVSLTYNYAITNTFTDVNRLAEGFVFSNYNSLFSGNRTLENSLSHRHTIRYTKFNLFNNETIFGNVTYNKRLDVIKQRALITGVNQVATSVNIDSNFPDETLSGSFNYGRSFFKYYKASLGVNLNWNKNNNIRVYPDGDTNPNNNPSEIQTIESVSQSYNFGVSTNYRKYPNLSVRYNYTINDNSSDIIYTKSPVVGLEYYFLDAFSLVSEYSFFENTNKSNTIENSYEFLSASINYLKKGSKWEYRISGTNLLNTKALNTNSFNQLGGTSTFSSFIVQPRFITLGVKYNL